MLQSYVGNVECGRLYVAVTSVNVTCANSASRRLVLTTRHVCRNTCMNFMFIRYDYVVTASQKMFFTGVDCVQ